MKEAYGIPVNQCYRNGDCLFGERKTVPKEVYYDYYDTTTRSYIFLECKLNQKFYTQSLLEIESAEKYHTPTGNKTYETPDLQLADQNGKWMTRSDDPDCYKHTPYDFEDKNCNICDLVCDIRDDVRYLKEDGSCPYNEGSTPEPIYWKIEDGDKPCSDFLHPMLLQNIESINRKRRKAAKAYIWKHLKNPDVMHKLINSGQRMIDVWKRNYKPVTFYYRSFEQILLYLKTVPRERKTEQFLQHVRKNLEYSPSFKQLLKDDVERRVLERLDKMVV